MADNDHLAWRKTRALEILRSGDIPGAHASMVTDLRSDPTTADHPAIALGLQLLMNRHLDTSEKMEKFINDFN